MTSNAELETTASAARDDQVQVLLVEDDDGDAVLVGELLREVGAAVVVRRARSLVQAKNLVSGAACVLLDLGLPDSQGLNGLRQLLQLEPEAAIVVLTGEASEHLGAGGPGRRPGLPGQGRGRRAHAEPGHPVRGRAAPR
jgi:Response regulator containing CheY-like receiver, AAA-type ATPase, and DNA-binding domains